MPTKTKAPFTATVLSTVTAPRGRKSAEPKWLWPGYLPAGSLGLFDGDPGLGKSLVSLDLAARVSKGMAWPDNAPGSQPGFVLIIASEDSRVEIAHRLAGSGADLSKIILLEDVGGSTPEFPRDTHIIEQIITEHKVKLVIIDPIMVYLGVTSAQDQQVRKAVHPLAQLAQKTGATIVMIRHLTKGGGRNAKHAGGGSMGLIGQCRFGYLFGADPENPARRVMATVKMNVGPEPTSRAFHLETYEKLPRVVWEKESEVKLDANDLLRGRAVDTAERNEREEAVAFLRDAMEMGGGVGYPTEIEKAGRLAGFSKSQLRTAKKKLQLKSRKVGAHWMWCEPDHDPRERAWLSVVNG